MSLPVMILLKYTPYMNFVEQFKSKLTIPRDIEGNPVPEVFNVVNIAHESLALEPEFICADPFGSSMKGYGDSSSDIDICIYLDFKIEGLDDFISRASEINERSTELERKVVDALSQNLIDTINIHVVSFYVDEKENIKRIREGFSDDETDASVVASLFRKVSGSRINYYRNSAIKEILLLSTESQNLLIDKMAVALVEKEEFSFYKIRERIEEQIDFRDIISERKKLWIARIRKLLTNYHE